VGSFKITVLRRPVGVKDFTRAHPRTAW